MAKTTKKQPRIILQGGNKINGKNYSYELLFLSPGQWEIILNTLEIKEEPYTIKERAQIIERVTNYRPKGADKMEAKDLNAATKKINGAISKNEVVIDGKIAGIEVEPFIVESKKMQTVEVEKTKTKQSITKTDKLKLYVRLNRSQVQKFIRNWVNSKTK